jgi:hypothetical protein
LNPIDCLGIRPELALTSGEYCPKSSYSGISLFMGSSMDRRAPPDARRSSPLTRLRSLGGVLIRSAETFRVPEPEDERDFEPEDFLPDERRGEEALIPSPMPERRLLDLRGVVTVDEAEAEAGEVMEVVPVDLLRMCKVEEVEEANIDDLPSVVTAPDLKGDLLTSAFPVTCLKLELVLLGPPCMTPAMFCSSSNVESRWL